MASRSDQLHSHQFMLQRVVGALATRDSDPVSSPMRRIGGALFAGVMLAVVALAAVGAYGVINPGGDNSWRDGASVIVEKESGARFVYRDGVLHPMANYASALLALGAAQPATVRVTRASLAGVPRGAPWGIPGAPDLLPRAVDLITSPWTVCSRATVATAATTTTAGAGVESVLLIGAEPGAGHSTLADRAVLAVDQANDLHLIWHGRRYPIRDRALVLAAFGWTSQPPTKIATALLNVLAPGSDLVAVSIPGRGEPSAVADARVGQVFVVQTQAGAKEYAVALADGLAAITQVQADLILSDPAHAGTDAPVELSQAAFGAAPKTSALTPTGDAAPPATTPELARTPAAGGVCAGFGVGGIGEVTVAPSLAPVVGEVAAAGGVDRVLVAPGRGAVVEALATPTAPSGALSVITDLGVRYPVPTSDVLTMLGYSGVTPQRLPAALVALLPIGHSLDPAAARSPVAITD